MTLEKSRNYDSLHLALQAVFICLSVLLMGCGKKAQETSDKKPDPQREPQTSEFDQLVKRQELHCDLAQCPEFLVKIGIRFEDKLNFCTGVMTDQKTVVTTANCVPVHLRVDSIDCSKDIYFFTYNSKTKNTVRSSCNKVIGAYGVESKDPVLWKNNVIYFELKSPLDINPVSISRLGLGNNDKFQVWSIDFTNDYVSSYRKSECEAVQNSYFNPLFNNQSSPVVTIAGCRFFNGNSGSPILDFRGRMRGLISASVDQLIVDGMVKAGLLENGVLKPIVHGTNYACNPTLYDNSVLDETECGKTLDERTLRDQQVRMLNYEDAFKTSMLKFEATLGNSNQYLKMSVVGNSLDFGVWKLSVKPKCFNDSSRWLPQLPIRDAFNVDVDIPERTLKFVMNEVGILQPIEIDRGFITHTFQFYPRTLRNVGRASVFMFRPSESWQTFPNISNNCSLL